MGFSYQWEKKSFIHQTGIQAMAVQERAAKHTATELSTALEMINIRPLDHVTYCFGGFFCPTEIVIMHHPTVSLQDKKKRVHREKNLSAASEVLHLG